MPLIYTFLSHLAYRFPRLEIKWIHVGDGEEFEIIKGQIDKRKPENFTVQLIGAIPNKDVQNFYLAQPIDCFITLSSSEGIPISICEALSYGVPVIATAVGGIPEIVSDKVGILLQEPTEIETFIIEISKYINDREAYYKLRKNAAAHWQQHFDAERLREKFAADISQT